MGSSEGAAYLSGVNVQRAKLAAYTLAACACARAALLCRGGASRSHHKGRALWAALAVAMIFLGSVHLGWHYALDGIVAWAMMWAIWVAAGAFLDRSGYSAAVRGENAEAAPHFAGRPVTI